jgi:phosphoribosyl 1,2-cyclic phosphodiesterase
VEYNGKNVGVFTDIGAPCENVTSHLKKCDALFLETNYDEKMLWNGGYPLFLKQRIASDYGHLSTGRRSNCSKPTPEKT